jgi:hypothetical protein
MEKAGRVLAAAAVVATLSIGLTSCGSGPSASSTTTTALPEALWLGQARVWLAAHGSDLTAISAAAKNLGDAAKAGSAQLTEIAVSQFLIAVGRADGDLPANGFGHDLHKVFVDYVTALSTIRKGVLKGDQATYKTGSNELAAAVAEFGRITARLKGSP